MRIGVFLGSELHAGGGFQYELTTLKILQKNISKNYEFVFFASNNLNEIALKSFGIKTILYRENFVDKIHRNLLRNVHVFKVFKLLWGNNISKIDRVLQKYMIDLVYFISPNTICADLTLHNYIFTVWDLCHRDHMEFPEVNFCKEFEIREKMYSRCLKKAVCVITESNLGKQNVIKRYQIDNNRVLVQTLLASEATMILNNQYNANQVDIKLKYNILNPYIFYPAQFWAHKNHIYILKALKILKDKYGYIISAVFSGSDKGNLGYILNKANEFGIKNQIKCIGFVDSIEIPCLYKQALALVMPTFFGPTNIPPLEAFKLDCPVCYSDLPGLKEQVSEAAWLLDLRDPTSLVNSILEIQNNKKLVQKKVSLGRQQVASQTEDSFWLNLKKVFDDFKLKRECWENNLYNG